MSALAGAAHTPVAVLSRSFGDEGEPGAAVRSLAGGISRHARVDVLVARPVGTRGPDGAFERIGIGSPEHGTRWPDPAHRAVPRGRTSYGTVLVDAGDVDALALARAELPSARVLVVGLAARTAQATAQATALDVAFHDERPEDARASRHGGAALPVGLYVRVHPDAAAHPHHELGGTTGYVLVLSGRDPAHAVAALPTGQVRWLLARFPRHRVVLVENGVATVWRSRAPTGRFGVHTRMDLWRLLAHARLTVDLCPGPLFARECVESLRYGVPVVVPRGTVADALVGAGGGMGFSSTATLLDAIEALGAPGASEQAGTRGHTAVARWYGDPAAFVARMAAALGPMAPAD